jgi:hypothetical protein
LRLEAAPYEERGRAEGETMSHDKEKYRRTCTLIEFLTQIAGAMEIAGELHESLSDRVDELIDPIRKDREWLRFAGSFIVRGGPLPEDFGDVLDAVEVRAFEAAPKLRLMVLEAFERHI